MTGSPLPKIDAEKRAKLVSAFDDATAQAAAAAAAMENMQADARAAADKASGAHKAVWVASRLVLLDEAQSTLAPLAKAIAAAFAEKRRTDAARQAVLAELRSDDETHREIFVGLGAFDRARPDAELVPHTPDTNEFHADWHALAAGLLQSAEAALGDAPVAPLPAHSRIEMPDPLSPPRKPPQRSSHKHPEMALMHELSDDDPIIRATSAITTGNIGRLNSAVASFQKRTDDLFKTIGD